MKAKAKSKDDKRIEEQSYRALELVLEQNKGKSFEQIKKATKDAYPFGERKGRAYKIWNRIWNHTLVCLEKGLVTY